MSEADQRDKMVSVILVSYNSADVIGKALAPIARHPNFEIIVVDNASLDDTVPYISEFFPSVRIIETGENHGFAKAVNIGIAASCGSHILLLNPDAIIEPRSIQLMLSDLLASRAGIVAPLIVHPGGRLRIVSAGSFPSIWSMFCHYFGLSRLMRRSDKFRGHYLLPSTLNKEPMSVDWVTGACMLFTKKTWAEVGGLTERWFMYAEDIDFCFRVRRQGLDVRLLPSMQASHIVGGSDSTEGYKLNPAWILNLHDFYADSMAPTRFHERVWCLVVGSGLLSRSLFYRLKSLKAGPGTDRLWVVEANRFWGFAKAVFLRTTSPGQSVKSQVSRSGTQ